MAKYTVYTVLFTVLFAVGCGSSAEGRDGQTGAAGAAGATGAVGTQGPQGPKGEKGDPGDPGTMGLKGDKGDPGTMGLQGTMGTPGNDGAMGLMGLMGTMGLQGAPGTSTPITKSNLYMVTGPNVTIPFGPTTKQATAQCTQGIKDYAISGGCFTDGFELMDFGPYGETDPTMSSGFSCDVYYPGGGTGAVIHATAICVHVP